MIEYLPKLKYIPYKGKNRIIILIPLVLFIALIGIYFAVFYKLPSPTSLRDYKVIPLSTHIYDRKGRLLYEVYGDQNRTPVQLETLPKYVYQATIAIEDKDFYRHGGVSIVGGILRAAKDTLFGKGGLQGGSTLTQQLVKSALLSPERTIQRKVREMVLAIWTEQIFSKNQILEMYLNQVPYGGSAYGIEEASKIYFGKSAKNLTVAEAALLAGLPQAPSLYSPYSNPDLAVKRRNQVIKRMYEDKYIDSKTRDKALNTQLSIIPLKTKINAPHFVFFVKNELEQMYGTREVEEGGLRVTTTLDLDIQKEAEKAVKEELDDVKYLNISNGAVLVTRPPTGEILSMVGSYDYFASPSGSFNVTTAMRQPGSSIKPINYAVGIDRKIVTAATVFLDVPTCFNTAGTIPYCPKNYDGKFHGLVPLRAALANSYNIPAVKMLAMNSVQDFVASTSAFMITSFKDPSRYGLALTLGGGEVRMYEMAEAFSSFANAGKPKKVQSILEVKDKSGKILYAYNDPNYIKDVTKPMRYPNTLAINAKPAISADTAYIVSNILMDNGARTAAFGPNSELVVRNKTVSVKTGTTDDYKDNWTIGYTPNFLVATWVGNNDGTPMNPNLVSGITGAAPIWNRVMSSILKNQPDLKPRKPENVVGKRICNSSGTLAELNPDGSSKCESRFEYFIKGTEGASTFKLDKQNVPVTKDSDKLAPKEGDNTEVKEKLIIKDKYSTYCVDCAGDQPPTPTP